MNNRPLIPGVLILCAAAGPLVGCSSDKPVNIGNTNRIGSQLSDYAASWDGYAEAFTFAPDGTDRVRLSIGSDGHGTLQVGNQPLVAPATDGNVGYPPGANSSILDDLRVPPLQEGFLYPVYSAQVQTDRIQVGIKSNDYYTSWCRLQTPFAYVIQTSTGGLDAGGGVQTVVAVDGGTGGADTKYMACPFQGGAASDTTCYGELNGGDPTPIDCGKYHLCNAQVCACTAGGCDSSPLIASGSAPSQYPVELDAALVNDGQMLTGTLALSIGTRITVVLQKQ